MCLIGNKNSKQKSFGRARTRYVSTFLCGAIEFFFHGWLVMKKIHSIYNKIR